MKKRPDRFLSEDEIDHSGVPFDYIKELHAYLWRVVRAARPGTNGILTNHVDSAVEKLEAVRRELDK